MILQGYHPFFLNMEKRGQPKCRPGHRSVYENIKSEKELKNRDQARFYF